MGSFHFRAFFVAAPQSQWFAYVLNHENMLVYALARESYFHTVDTSASFKVSCGRTEPYQ
jgi:hypothetical protein